MIVNLGGSHDRNDLFPLKFGASFIALGAMAAEVRDDWDTGFETLQVCSQEGG